MDRNVVIKIDERPLPRALVSSDEFAELEQVQKENFVSRLRYIEEIPVKIREYLALPDRDREIKPFLDRVELDLMINVGASGDARSSVSPWILHSAWTFDASSRAMRSGVDRTLLEVLEQPQANTSSTMNAFMAWLTGMEQCLSSLLDGFYQSSAFDGALGHLIAVDVCLAQMYSGFIAQRLNPKVFQLGE